MTRNAISIDDGAKAGITFPDYPVRIRASRESQIRVTRPLAYAPIRLHGPAFAARIAMGIRDRFWQLFSRAADAFQVLGIGGLLAMASSFALPAWAASVSQWPPIAWVACGFAGVLLFVLAALGWRISQRYMQQAATWQAMSKQTYTVNPLEQVFRNQRIRVADLQSPFNPMMLNKTFIDCEFLGPGNIAFMNSQVELEHIADCDFAEIKQGAFVFNVLGFSHATFRRCKFYKVTFLMLPPDAANLRRANPNIALNWITPVGDNRNEPQGGQAAQQVAPVRQGA